MVRDVACLSGSIYWYSFLLKSCVLKQRAANVIIKSIVIAIQLVVSSAFSSKNWVLCERFCFGEIDSR